MQWTPWPICKSLRQSLSLNSQPTCQSVHREWFTFYETHSIENMKAINNQQCPPGPCQITWTCSVFKRAEYTLHSKGPALLYQVHFSRHAHLTEHRTHKSFFHVDTPLGILRGVVTLSPGTLNSTP